MNKSRKNEIRDKVKEMKQRQQNWMKQRAEIQNSSSSPNALTSVTAQKENTSLSREKPEYHEGKTFIKSRDESSIEGLLATNKSKAKFQNWLKAKESQESDNEDDEMEDHVDEFKENSKAVNFGANKTVYKSANYNDGSIRQNSLRFANSGKPKMLHPSSVRSESTDPGFNSEDETGEITAATLLSPEDFDSRADDIIARVKGDLKLSTKYSKGVFNNVSNAASFVAMKSSPSKEADVSENSLASHVCPTCEKLMMPPSSSAMLLIPCGHTLCTSCSQRTKYCAMCGCAVQSTTPNIMLQQIITNFHTKQTHRQKTIASIRTVPKKNYEEEYQNLLTRRDILKEEAENITSVIDDLSHQLKRERKQVYSIESKEKTVEAEISKLQQQLQQLASHRMEYERKCDEIEIQSKEETNRLNLVKDSLSSVQLQIDKVKLLAGH
ncbi:uncharacterized protein LOC127856501 isoform X3 [Dreissena polymorpha]|uniref:uncharacterized protein LOC127856501 isoform X3 n=1 Tax=Dreissena polymorpha TaxID=45954 RepID=UPI002264BCAD|nr:uncharacterized protein LOC127856501 isoform X3 [Dreissena polymorpha]